MPIGRAQRRIIGSVDPPKLEGYTITRRLGFGAASVIYEARQEDSGSSFAIKHVVRADGEDKRMIDQVETEYRNGMKIDHPYIRKVYKIERRKRRLVTREVVMLMEYCRGVSLEQSRMRTLLDLLIIFRMVAEGLDAMHSCGLLHCDMKPNNIIISDKGHIHIIDLGQSCEIGTVKPRIQGTPDYIAPEQVKRKHLTPKTDVFNFGATFYWALTGRNIPTMIPKTSDRVELAREPGPPPSPSELKEKIPVGVSNLVMECVKKSPKDRPAEMSSIITRLDMLIRMIGGKRLTTLSKS